MLMENSPTTWIFYSVILLAFSKKLNPIPIAIGTYPLDPPNITCFFPHLSLYLHQRFNTVQHEQD